MERGYKEDHVDSENARVKLVKRTVSFQKRDKKVDDSITLVLTYHPALNQLYEILQRIHKHVLNLPRLHSALPSPSRVAFRNPKAMRDKLVRSKLKEFIYKDAGNDICGHSNCDICNIFESEYQFESTTTKKKCRISFSFDCNSCYLVNLLACLNQCKSNIKLNGKGRRGFKKEKLIEDSLLSQCGHMKILKFK